MTEPGLYHVLFVSIALLAIGVYGFLTRKNPFFLSVASCIELFGQQSFGFPNERHMRLGEKIGFYREVNQILEARWSPRKKDFFQFSNIYRCFLTIRL